MSIEISPLREQEMKVDDQAIEIDRSEDTDFPPWSLWAISLWIIAYSPIASVLGTPIGQGVGLIARSLNDLFFVMIELNYIIFIAAILGSTLPFALFLLFAHFLLLKGGYSWENVWVSYDLDFVNMIVSLIIGTGLGFLIFSIINSFLFKPNVLVDLGIGYKSNLIFSILNYVFIAAVFEEIFFRGIFFQALKKYLSIQMSVLMSALFFSLNHMFYSNGFDLLIIFIFGIIAAVLFQRTKSLYCNLILHLSYNATLLYMWL
jgi:uncharacterized protein